jgi:anhydro-N-acetylmuramic acid kinase
VRVIGLMSGTSLDGIDAALVELDGETEADVQWRVLAFRSLPYERSRREEIQQAIAGGGPAELCRLNARLGRWFAEAARAVCEDAGCTLADVDLIGSHGQTVWHIPPEGGGAGEPGATLQLGSAAEIAERTGVAVVSDRGPGTWRRAVRARRWCRVRTGSCSRCRTAAGRSRTWAGWAT